MQLITISQAASRCAISARMIRKLIEQTELPVVRVGRCVRLREDDVDALIRRGYTGESQLRGRGFDVEAVRTALRQGKQS